ncbi:MAG: hypothetical protein ABRQ39_00760 [Candidatus Eremiobacterota bacterium]
MDGKFYHNFGACIHGSIFKGRDIEKVVPSSSVEEKVTFYRL